MAIEPKSESREDANAQDEAPKAAPVNNLTHGQIASLSSFEENIAQIEVWIATVTAALNAVIPDVKALRILSLDIPPVLEEATQQAIEDGPTELTSRYLALNPRLIEVVRRTNELFKLQDSDSTSASVGGPPLIPPVDTPPSKGDDGDMLKRIEKLESDVAAIKIDVAVIKANGAAKSDMAELRGALTKDSTELKGAFGELRAATKADIADAKTAIILWVVGAIFVAQILPAILKAIPEFMAMLGK